MSDEPVPEELEKKYDEIFSGVEGKNRVIDEAYIENINDEELLNESEPESKQGKNEDDSDLNKSMEEEDTSEKASEPAGDEDEYEDIPDYLVQAGHAHGFTDEKIIDLAENSPEVLEALAETYKNYQEAAASWRQKDAKTEKVGPNQDKNISEKTPEFLGKLEIPELEDVEPEIKKLVKTLVEDRNKMVGEINSFRSQIDSVREQRNFDQQQRNADYSKKVDTFFDKAGIKQLGNAKTLTQEQANARTEIHKIATVLQGDNSYVTDENLGKAVKAFKGLYGIKDSSETDESKLARKLQLRKKKFTARPGGRKGKTVIKDEKTRAFAAMDSVADKHGFKFTG